MTKDKMIYNDDQTIGVDESSLNQLMNILTPRMQKQLVVSLKEEKFLHNHHNNSEVKQWAAILKAAIITTAADQILQFVTTTCYT